MHVLPPSPRALASRHTLPHLTRKWKQPAHSRAHACGARQRAPLHSSALFDTHTYTHTAQRSHSPLRGSDDIGWFIQHFPTRLLPLLARVRECALALRRRHAVLCRMAYCGGHEPEWCLRQLSTVPDAYFTVSGLAEPASEFSFASTPALRDAICANDASLERLYSPATA